MTRGAAIARIVALGRARSRSSRSSCSRSCCRRTSCTSAPCPRRSRERDDGRATTASASAGEVVPGSVARDRDGVRVRDHRRQGDGRGRAPRRPARPVQGRRARRVRGPLERRRRLRLRPHPDPARQRVRAARRSTPTTERRRPREGDARRPRAGARAPARRVLGIAHARVGLAPRRRATAAHRPPLRVRGARRRRVARRRRRWSGRCSRHDFSIEYVAENNARATPLLYTITGPVGRARGLDPAVGARPRRLPRVHGPPLPRPRHRSARGVGDARRASSSRCSSSC